MKISRFLIIAIAASTSFLTACTSEEEEASARHELVFQLGMGNAETRATPEGTWTVGDYIAVKVGNTVKQYIITSTDGKAKGINYDNTFYWEDLGESSIKVTAWSFGKDYYETLPSVITVLQTVSNSIIPAPSFLVLRLFLLIRAEKTRKYNYNPERDKNTDCDFSGIVLLPPHRNVGVVGEVRESVKTPGRLRYARIIRRVP